ncbi:MAG: NAD(P)H-dependent oxidoreductase subunit E [Gammaproteobacteria bacterium]|nr:NAD(P)H-dependent oxidoreductase subunit E [Gammaproteobacteria bacterium]
MLEQETKKEIDHWMTKYPEAHKRSAIVSALLAAQKQNGGWLSNELIEAVADYMGLASIQAFEVATFYDMYQLKPIGKHKISMCTTMSCMLRGSDELVDAVKKRLGIGFGETTADGKITLCESQCLAACGNAPMCQVDDEALHLDLTEEKMMALIDSLEQEAK